jgi:transcriptional regulator of acetoin/glycerol metabolism
MELAMKVFDDLVGQRTKELMRNYANSGTRPIDQEELEEAINAQHKIVELTRQAITDILEAETEVLCMRMIQDKNIPTVFISGVIHATEIIKSGNLIMGNDIVQ